MATRTRSPRSASGPTERFAHRARIAKQPRQAAEIKDNLPGLRSMPLAYGQLISIRGEPSAQRPRWARRSHQSRFSGVELARDHTQLQSPSVGTPRHRDTEDMWISCTAPRHLRRLVITATMSPRPSLPPRPVASARRHARSRPGQRVDGCETRPPLSLGLRLR